MCFIYPCAVDIATLNYIFLYLSSSLFIGLWTQKQDISFISIESFFFEPFFFCNNFHSLENMGNYGVAFLLIQLSLQFVKL